VFFELAQWGLMHWAKPAAHGETSEWYAGAELDMPCKNRDAGYKNSFVADSKDDHKADV
jgi:hypothetical protein